MSVAPPELAQLAEPREQAVAAPAARHEAGPIRQEHGIITGESGLEPEKGDQHEGVGGGGGEETSGGEGGGEAGATAAGG